MATAAILNFRNYAILMQHLRSMSDSQHPHQNLVTIGSIVMKWQPIFEIQDGGGRHLETYTSG